MNLNRTVRSASEQWVFQHSSASTQEQGEKRIFRDAASAQQWAQKFQKDSQAMMAIRSLVANSIFPAPLSGMKDSAVIARFANLLASGRLHAFLAPSPVRRGGYVASQASEPEAASQKPRTVSSSPAPPPPTDPDTFPTSLDSSSMADALMNGAKSGASFCEECAKAQAAA